MVVVADVAVEVVDLECRNRRFLRIRFLCMSTNDKAAHPNKTQIALK